MEQRIPIKTIYLLAVIAMGLTILAVGSTYAVFTASDSIDNPITIASNLESDTQTVETIDLTIGAGKTKTITLNINNTEGINLNYACWYVTDAEDVTAYIAFDSSISSGTGTIASNQSLTVRVSITNASDSSSDVLVGISSSTGEISLSSDMKVIGGAPSVPLATYISGLYESNSTATNNSITYNLDTNNKLMEDSFGNIRYYGNNPNNYIYFNCGDYNSSATCYEVWRIIGFVDGKVKIIKDEAIRDINNQITGLAWDLDVNIGGQLAYDNVWHNSSLGWLLNVIYYNGDTMGEGIYYSGQYGESVSYINFFNEGIQNNATRELISESTWYLGGWSSGSASLPTAYPNMMYYYERVNGSNTINSSVGLASASDYGYAVDLSLCQNKGLSGYSDLTCSQNNWMLDVMSSSGYDSWLLTAEEYYPYYAWYVGVGGAANYNVKEVYQPLSVFPVVYLDSDVVVDLSIGDGTASRPYKIIIE